MGIDYLLCLDCPVKQALSVEQMVELIKGRDRAEQMVALARAAGSELTPDEIRFRVQVTTPDGVTEKPVSAADLLEAAKALDAQAPHCTDCAANVLGHPFGCYGSIGYPIEEATERWLLARLPDDLSTVAGTLCMAAIEERGYDGSPLADMRAAGQTFFERPQAAKRRWGPRGRPRPAVSSDNLLHMLFCVGAVNPVHAMLVLLYLGFFPHDLPPEQVGRAANDAETRRELANHLTGPVEPPTEQVSHVLDFCNTLLRGMLLELPVSVDY